MAGIAFASLREAARGLAVPAPLGAAPARAPPSDAAAMLAEARRLTAEASAAAGAGSQSGTSGAPSAAPPLFDVLGRACVRWRFGRV
jgi:hypothetical protein